MGKFTPVAQVPRYMEEFQCAGSACPENCCTGWTISIDKPTYQRYQAIKIEPLAGLVRAHVRKGAEPSAYAAIKLDAEQPCPFLDTERLCQIQAKLGAVALSSTCNNYPRAYSQAGDQLGMVAQLSCPEAARLALQSADAMDMLPIPLPYANTSLVPVMTQRAKPTGTEPDLVMRHAPLLQEVFSAVVRWPQFSAADALVHGGLIVRKIVALSTEPDRAQADLGLCQALEHYLDPQQLAQASQSAKALNMPKRHQVSILLNTTQQFIQQNGGRPTFRQLVEEIKLGLMDTAGGDSDSLDAVTARYEHAEQSYFRPIIEAQPHLLKNYLLNDLARTLFPRRDSASLEADYMSLAVRFALIKCYLIGVAAAQKEQFSSAQFSRVVYIFARNVEHNSLLIPTVLKTLQDNNAMRQDVLALLVS